ncbi:putative UDP-4-amino-4-deoxy-L-arabinose--oxoglutarate aminotransferase [Pelagibacter phage Mosig EXVC030M]|nr:putative UDP-4-amino-4-deoxy-L-arabinose--oxoglutarate aminotransferase [Pelagibacter phage Mosig EXVC030M]
MTGWDKEYLINNKDYIKLFDKSMQREQESNVEFLEKNLSKRLGRNVVVCANGTDALHFALLSKNIGPGDEVLVTNFSWISTASVISMVGATPVFCDIDIDTYHMSFESIKKMYSDKVKAIIYPHLFGNMSDTSMIKEFCQDKNIVFIEDACQSLGSSYNGVVAGTIGDISTLSFNANKVVAGISGGGAIATDGDTEIFKKLRRHGNNEMLGYNSKMLLFNAEVINYRLNKLDEYIEKRQKIAKQYDKGLKDYVVVQPNTGGHNYHKYVIRFQNKIIRDKIKEKLGAKVHYENPISENKMYNNIKHRKDTTYTSKIVSDTILSLPIHPYMDTGEVNRIIVTIQIMLDLENDKLVNSMKKVIGDDLFDKSLINESTEDIYDYIVEKTYQWPEYIEEVEFKDKRKLKIAFNKFYENITTNTK